jgi:hypothetical protein
LLVLTSLVSGLPGHGPASISGPAHSAAASTGAPDLKSRRPAGRVLRRDETSSSRKTELTSCRTLHPPHSVDSVAAWPRNGEQRPESTRSRQDGPSPERRVWANSGPRVVEIVRPPPAAKRRSRSFAPVAFAGIPL